MRYPVLHYLQRRKKRNERLEKLNIRNPIAILRIHLYYYTMKTLFIPLALLILTSCTKPSLESNVAANEPEAAAVQSVTWGPVYAGGNMSIAFTVNLIVTSPVTKVNLFRANYLQLVWEVKNPQTGTYTMYNHIVDVMHTYPQHEMYFFEFLMADGSKVLTEPFQVY